MRVVLFAPQLLLLLSFGVVLVGAGGTHRRRTSGGWAAQAPRWRNADDLLLRGAHVAVVQVRGQRVRPPGHVGGRARFRRQQQRQGAVIPGEEARGRGPLGLSVGRGGAHAAERRGRRQQPQRRRHGPFSCAACAGSAARRGWRAAAAGPVRAR